MEISWNSRVKSETASKKSTLLKESNTEGKKRWEDEEEDLSGYQITLKKRDDTVN
jgi:hypothetical protein